MPNWNYKNIFILLLTLSSFGVGQNNRNMLKITNSGLNCNPVISSDGKYVAYVEKKEIDEEFKGIVCIYNVIQKTTFKISNSYLEENFDEIVSWSDKKKEFVFSTSNLILAFDPYTNQTDTLLGTLTPQISFFAPSISPDGSKLSFWVLFEIAGKPYCSIWILDFNTNDIIRLPEQIYYAQTEEIWYPPTWFFNSRKIVGLFSMESNEKDLSYSQSLFLFDVNTKSFNEFEKNVSSLKAETSDYDIFFTKIFKGINSLFSKKNDGLHEKLVIKNIDGQYDFINNDTSKILFTRGKELFIKNGDKFKNLKIKTDDFCLSNDLIVFSSSEGRNRNIYLTNIRDFIKNVK